MILMAFFSLCSILIIAMQVLSACRQIDRKQPLHISKKGYGMKKGCAWILAAVLACSLTGCAIIQEQQTQQEADTMIAGEQFPEKLDNGKADIYLITKGYGSQYWDTLRDGAKAAAETYDCNLYVAGVSSEAYTEYIAQLMQEALEAQADAVIVSPADASQIIEAADQIKKAGIPLIFVDTILNSSDYDVCYATDNMQAGRMAAKEMIKLLHQKGRHDTETLTVGIDIGVSESQTILERLAGFQEYWSNYAPGSWKVIDDIKINNGDIDLAEKQGYEFMEKGADLAGLVGLNNGSTVGLARSIVKCECTNLVLVGFDYSDEMKQLITGKEYLAASIVQRQYDMGYGSVEQAVKLVAGETLEYRYVDTGVQQVDHDNVDSPYIREILGE